MWGCRPGPPRRVLIVDDQPAFRGMARTVLEWRGYVVAGEADSGFEVACALTQAHPELAVVLVSSIDYGRREPLVRECGARGFVLKSELACAELEDFWPACGV